MQAAGSHNPVIRAFASDLNVMHMAFLEPGPGDLHEIATLAHLFYGRIAGVAHGGPKPTH